MLSWLAQKSAWTSCWQFQTACLPPRTACSPCQTAARTAQSAALPGRTGASPGWRPGGTARMPRAPAGRGWSATSAAPVRQPHGIWFLREVQCFTFHKQHHHDTLCGSMVDIESIDGPSACQAGTHAQGAGLKERSIKSHFANGDGLHSKSKSLKGLILDMPRK